MADKVPIEQQIAEVKRELALRGNVYPGLVSAGKMKQAEAQLFRARMTGVLRTLEFCQMHEFQIRDYIRSLGQKVAE